MPGENIQDWSTTAANNATADSSINWAEGQPRASVNNSARSMMAAHAKDRNVRNGSIVTGGTANAQTFASGLSYTSTPSGLRVMLKIGSALTNTTAATLNMDGIGNVAIVDLFAHALIGNELIADSYREFLFDGTNWIVLNAVASGTGAGAGRLVYVSATQVAFVPYAGNLVKINGQVFSIPSTGIIANNTSTFVNTVPGNNLVANTSYYVALFLSAGVPTINFVTVDVTHGHMTSQTTGNVGTEIITVSGSPLDSQTLIGMVATNASAQFQNNTTWRGVISWLNRRNLHMTGSVTAGSVTTSTTPVELDGGARIVFCCWAEESAWVGLTGSVAHGLAGNAIYPAVFLDGTISVTGAGQSVLVAGQFQSATSSAGFATTEGFHYLTPFGNVSSSLSGGTFNIGALGMVRG